MTGTARGVVSFSTYTTDIPSRTARWTLSWVLQHNSCMNGRAISRSRLFTGASSPISHNRKPIA